MVDADILVITILSLRANEFNKINKIRIKLMRNLFFYRVRQIIDSMTDRTNYRDKEIRFDSLTRLLTLYFFFFFFLLNFMHQQFEIYELYILMERHFLV